MTERPAAASAPAGHGRGNKKDDEEEEYGSLGGAKDEDGKGKMDGNGGNNQQQQRRLHVWTDRQVVLMLRAAVALKMGPSSMGWGKMTGCYAEMAKMLREAPDAAEEWGENVDATLTVPKIRSKFESVMLRLSSNEYRLKSKDPKIRDELQELFNKLRSLQAARTVVSPQEAQKRWRDELEKLRQLWVATKKTSLPKTRVQSALKLIRDLKKLRPQLDAEGNCVFPDGVLFDGKVSSEIAAQAQAAVALAKSTNTLGADSVASGDNDENDDQADDDDDDENSDAVGGPADQQDDSEPKQNDVLGRPASPPPPPPPPSSSQPQAEDDLSRKVISHLLRSDGVQLEEEGEKRMGQKNTNDELGSAFVPEKKRLRTDNTPPSEGTCKELITLLKQVLDAQHTSHFCSDCDDNGERCNCRYSRTQLLTSLVLTDSCPSCHHPICHHP